MSNRRTCAFCGASGVKISNEHAWPNWIRALFPAGPTTIIGTRPGRKNVVFSPPEGDMGVTVNVVCKATCNEGWMSALEESVKPFLAPMIRDGAATTLTPIQQATLTRWALKTAMVFEFTDRTSEPFYTFEERDALRRRLLPMGSTIIESARHHGQRFLSTAHARRMTFTGTVKSRAFPLSAVSTTISVGQFVVQVFSLRSTVDAGMWVPWDSEFTPCVVRLWPPVKDSLPTWPAAETLDDGALERFITRLPPPQKRGTPNDWPAAMPAPTNDPADPRIEHTIALFSTIYLGGIPPTITNDSSFLAFINVLAATEALAGFRYANTIQGKARNGKRFKAFIAQYFPEPYKSWTDRLWTFRCRMVHSFSVTGFVLIHHHSEVHLKTDAATGNPVLNAEDFYAALLSAAQSYFADVRSNADLRAIFLQRLDDRAEGGPIGVGPLHVK